jgi:hypothetical protein
MGYRERLLRTPGQPNPSRMTIDGALYDIDCFGMDDGYKRGELDAFRFLFELGSGLSRYVYVIQAGALHDNRHFFHTFWFKDIITVDMDPEEQGPPKRVSCVPVDLPLVYTCVAVGDTVYPIQRQTFMADGEALTMNFALAGREPLVWTRAAGWSTKERRVFSPAGDE